VTAVFDEETERDCEILDQKINAGAFGSQTPKIVTDEEAAFTAYQKTILTFRSPTNISRVRIEGLYMPQIPEIQDWILQSGISPLGTDILVKGAVPTLIQFGAVLHIPSGFVLDETEMKNELANFINAIPFEGTLAASSLLSLLHTKLPYGSFITSPSIFATTYLPDGNILETRTMENHLSVRKIPTVSNRTTLFYCDPRSINFEYRVLNRSLW
jgi:hypothetical protein